MSDDLINRKALRDELCKYRQQFSIGSCENITVSTAIGFVNTAPTALNKEKVIEEMQKHSHNYYPSIDHYCLSRKAVDLKDAIEIIEKGGLN